MQGTKLARAWYAATAVVALVGLVTNVITTATATDSPFATPAGRLGNLFTYFTIDSNLLVTGVSVVLALGLASGKSLFRVLWLDALAGIIVTGVVYQVALAGLYHLSGAALFSDVLLHRVTPVAFVLGWLVFGPRGALAWRTVWLGTIYPLTWLAFTLVRGAMTGYYPYPFIDAGALGYGQVTLNCLFIAVFLIGLMIGALLLDRVFARRLAMRTAEVTP